MKKDEFYMTLALRLAKRGKKTIPNPRVGAVIVKNDKIIGQGYHSVFGGPHAEVVAIQSAEESVKGATMYVTLEPCSHYGKTPPCTERIIKEGIKRVVIGMVDPNPLVCGRGISRLKDAGLEVKVGVLSEKAQELNRDFIKFVKTEKPYVYLKIATTLDGKIALANGKSKWITNEQARKMVHSLRAQVDAVLVGIDTVLVDNPYLNVRYGYKNSALRKVVLDTFLRLPEKVNLMNEPHMLVVFYKSGDEAKKQKLMKSGVTLIQDNSPGEYIDLNFALGEMYKLGIYRVLIEGGKKVFSSFLRENLVDELWWIFGNKVFGSGISGLELPSIENVDDALSLRQIRTRRIGDNILVRGYLNVYGDY